MAKTSRKGAIQFDELIIWVIGIVVLLFVAAWYLDLGSKLTSIVDGMKSFLRFG